jgi:uncharacterized protein YegP (UPF0339 family)
MAGKRKLRVHIFTDRNGEFRWRLRSRNGKIVADSAEGYELRSQAVKGITMIAAAFKADEFDTRFDLLDEASTPVNARA